MVIKAKGRPRADECNPKRKNLGRGRDEFHIAAAKKMDMYCFVKKMLTKGGGGENSSGRS